MRRCGLFRNRRKAGASCSVQLLMVKSYGLLPALVEPLY